MRSLIIILLSFFQLLSHSQDDHFEHIDYNGDTILLPVYKDPTICDCVNKGYHNTEQEKYCDKKYDFDFMTKEERAAYDERRDICRWPSICDCAKADMNDKSFIKKCDQQFNSDHLSERRRNEIREDLEACLTDTILSEEEEEEELYICDCINITPASELFESCERTFFNDSLSDSLQSIYGKKMQECIEDKKYSIEVSLCDCIRLKDDKEVQQKCNEVYNPKNMDSTELKHHETNVRICIENEALSPYFDTTSLTYISICSCLDPKDLTNEEKLDCLKLYDPDNFTPEQIQFLKSKAQRCFDQSSFNLTPCDCLFRGEDLNEQEEKQCEEILNNLDHNSMERLLQDCLD